MGRLTTAQPAEAPPPIAHQLLALPALVRFSHTLFALPFAVAGALLAARLHGAPSAGTWGLILLAMIAARSAAMAYNRLVDRDLDARNPRTEGRHLPRGLVTPGLVRAFIAFWALVFFVAARALNELCGWLSLVALVVIFAYSWTKRLTALSHFVLGLALACAPIGGFLAVAGRFEAAPLTLGLAVLLWVAGFDVIYATLDVDYDRRAGLHSIPARLGVPKALRLSALLHAGTVAALGATGLLAGLSWPWYAGIGLVAAVLATEHAIVRPEDLSRVNTAFFHANVAVSALVCAAVGADWALA
ncbi:MAG: putative 4-hydroxybenzoate polyprenyltransferase [Planctomycetales bacterium]|nr:putative 4-hydroxybenzoate polyprenyltransferase [Planctomycetales bacterium]